MLEFPRSTIFNKRIPKQKFYANLGISSSVERQFVTEIDSIYWRNKLSSETLNISKGTIVTEIEIIEIQLKGQEISRNVIAAIDREIPYHLVFILIHKEMCQIWISYKEGSKSKQGKFKVESYYVTPWQKLEDLSLKIEGLNLDKVYDNFILQVAGGKLRLEDGENIKDAVTRSSEIDKLEANIKNMEVKILNEKQYNRQVKAMGELRKLKAKLENYQK